MIPIQVCGLPIIATDSTGAPDLINDGVEGFKYSDFITGTASTAGTNQVELRVQDGTNLTRKDVDNMLEAFQRFRLRLLRFPLFAQGASPRQLRLFGRQFPGLDRLRFRRCSASTFFRVTPRLRSSAITSRRSSSAAIGQILGEPTASAI